MSRRAAVPPSQVPFLLPDRTVHPAWRRLLEALQERTGGYDGVTTIADTDATTWTGEQTFDDIVIRPAAADTPAAIGDLVIQRTSNVSLTFKLKGTDGVVRSGSIVLA